MIILFPGVSNGSVNPIKSCCSMMFWKMVPIYRRVTWFLRIANQPVGSGALLFRSFRKKGASANRLRKIYPRVFTGPFSAIAISLTMVKTAPVLLCILLLDVRGRRKSRLCLLWKTSRLKWLYTRWWPAFRNKTTVNKPYGTLAEMAWEIQTTLTELHWGQWNWELHVWYTGVIEHAVWLTIVNTVSRLTMPM